MKHTILIKYGEIALKGKNRPAFEQALKERIAKALDIAPTDIRSVRGRMYIAVPERSRQEIIASLSNVFGMTGFSFAIELNHEHSLDTIESVMPELLEKAKEERDLTFRVETRRASKHFPMDSMEINKQLGSYVLERFPSLQVRLNDPDITVNIEIREEGTFVYTNKDEFPGPGGLPSGTSGSGLLLLSGGIDSPVAGWRMMKRGLHIDAVYFHSAPYVGEKTKEKVRDLAKELSRWQGQPVRLFIVPFSDIQIAINEGAPDRYWTVLHRRYMMRIAQGIAEREGIDALITGENLGQVASQTIYNMQAAAHNLDMPVLRPLIGLDKQEIIDTAQRIDTFTISARPHEDCCTVFSPDRPATKVLVDDVVRIEEGLPDDSAVQEAIDGTEVIFVSYQGA